MKEKLLIIGAGGHGKVVADIALNMGKWTSIAFLDDNESKTSSMGIRVLGKPDEAFKYVGEFQMFVAIGNNAIRADMQETLESQGANIPVLIHPNAVIGAQVAVAPGTVVMAGSVINCDTKIGKGCIVNTGATIDHDNLLEDFVHISPGVHLAGSVKVGQRSWLGISSTVCNNLSIVQDCMVGAGAVVVNDITKPGTYVGIPARRASR